MQEQAAQCQDEMQMSSRARGPLTVQASLPHYILPACMCQFDSLSCIVYVVAAVLLPA